MVFDEVLCRIYNANDYLLKAGRKIFPNFHQGLCAIFIFVLAR